MWTIFKVFIEFVTISLLFFVFWVFLARGMWDLSSPTRDWTCTPCIGRRSLSHWTARDVLEGIFNLKKKREPVEIRVNHIITLSQVLHVVLAITALLTSLTCLLWDYLCEKTLRNRALYIYIPCRLSKGLFGRRGVSLFFFSWESKTKTAGWVPPESQVNLMEKQTCTALEDGHWLPCKVLKTRQQAQNGFAYASHRSPNWDLTPLQS